MNQESKISETCVLVNLRHLKSCKSSASEPGSHSKQFVSEMKMNQILLVGGIILLIYK